MTFRMTKPNPYFYSTCFQAILEISLLSEMLTPTTDGRRKNWQWKSSAAIRLAELKRWHQIKTRSTASVGKGTWSQLCYYRHCGLWKSACASHLKAPSRKIKNPGPGDTYNRVFNFGSLQTQGRGVFEPKQLDSLPLPW